MSGRAVEGPKKPLSLQATAEAGDYNKTQDLTNSDEVTYSVIKLTAHVIIIYNALEIRKALHDPV